MPLEERKVKVAEKTQKELLEAYACLYDADNLKFNSYLNSFHY